MVRMLQRIWNIAKRHRKKLVFSAVLAGGTYYVWKIWLLKFQQLLIQNFLKEGRLARGVSGGAGRGDGVGHSPAPASPQGADATLGTLEHALPEEDEYYSISEASGESLPADRSSYLYATRFLLPDGVVRGTRSLLGAEEALAGRDWASRPPAEQQGDDGIPPPPARTLSPVHLLYPGTVGPLLSTDPTLDDDPTWWDR